MLPLHLSLLSKSVTQTTVIASMLVAAVEYRYTQKNYLLNLVDNENARVSHLPRVDGVQNSLNNFDLSPVTLNYDL